VGEIGDKLDVIMIPKVEGPWDLHYVDRLRAQLEARHGIREPLLVHAILETALGVANVEEIAAASPRMQGMSFGPADLAASRRMKTTRVGGGHPAYLVRTDPDPNDANAPRQTAQQDPWHYSMGRMVDACASTGILPFYGPFGDIGDPIACEDQFRNAFLMGCVGAWSLHPSQIEIARRVFSPPPDEVAWARRVIEAMGDGSGTVMLDGKMQDDATVKQCRVMVGLAKLIGRGDPELRKVYGRPPTLTSRSPSLTRVVGARRVAAPAPRAPHRVHARPRLATSCGSARCWRCCASAPRARARRSEAPSVLFTRGIRGSVLPPPSMWASSSETR
jgi:malyl-CoA/(S)-citramalyl-CoA lyase